MSFFDLFRIPNKKGTAAIAKERLQIIISHERKRYNPDYLAKMQQELLDVIAKYITIERESIKIEYGKDGGNSILALNVTLQDSEETVKT